MQNVIKQQISVIAEQLEQLKPLVSAVDEGIPLARLVVALDATTTRLTRCSNALAKAFRPKDDVA